VGDSRSRVGGSTTAR